MQKIQRKRVNDQHRRQREHDQHQQHAPVQARAGHVPAQFAAQSPQTLHDHHQQRHEREHAGAEHPRIPRAQAAVAGGIVREQQRAGQQQHHCQHRQRAPDEMRQPARAGHVYSPLQRRQAGCSSAGRRSAPGNASRSSAICSEKRSAVPATFQSGNGRRRSSSAASASARAGIAARLIEIQIAQLILPAQRKVAQLHVARLRGQRRRPQSRAVRLYADVELPGQCHDRALRARARRGAIAAAQRVRRHRSRRCERRTQAACVRRPPRAAYKIY